MIGADGPTVGAEAGPIVEARGLWKRYHLGRVVVEALRGVDVTVRRGEIVAIMGPSGCGKTTLLHCLSGLDDVDAGVVILAGASLREMSDDRKAEFRARNIGFVFQSYNLLPVLSAVENVELPLLLAGARGREARRRALETLEAVGLADRSRHRPSELSGGQQQRVAVARALVGEPKLILADEPTGNLDSRASAEVLGFLQRSVREMGQTVVMVTHDPTAAAYADHVVFLDDGHVVDQMPRPTAEAVLDRMKSLGG